MGGLGKLIGAKGFKKLPKVQRIAQSGHTDYGKEKLFICVRPSTRYPHTYGHYDQ